jgi:hypothetical protein
VDGCSTNDDADAVRERRVWGSGVLDSVDDFLIGRTTHKEDDDVSRIACEWEEEKDMRKSQMRRRGGVVGGERKRRRYLWAVRRQGWDKRFLSFGTAPKRNKNQLTLLVHYSPFL